MLKGLTWEQFCWFSAVLGFLWYGAVVLLCYRREVLALFGARPVGLAGSGRGAGVIGTGSLGKKASIGGSGLGDAVELEVDSLMGKPVLPVGVSVLGMDQVAFVAGPSVVDPGEQVGLVADVVEDLKGIFAQLEREAGGRAEFFVLLAGLKEVYGKIGGHPSIGAINEFVVEHAPFEVMVQEMEGVWS